MDWSDDFILEDRFLDELDAILLKSCATHGCEPCLFTGGADGSDVLFEAVARLCDHSIKVMSFDGHRLASLPYRELHRRAVDIVRLSHADLVSGAKSAAVAASAALKRRLPEHPVYVRNLLLRDYFQVQDVERVYAVSSFESLVRMMPDGRMSAGGGLRVGLNGGTAWAVQMFVLRKLRTISFLDMTCRLFQANMQESDLDNSV